MLLLGAQKQKVEILLNCWDSPGARLINQSGIAVWMYCACTLEGFTYVYTYIYSVQANVTPVLMLALSMSCPVNCGF